MPAATVLRERQLPVQNDENADANIAVLDNKDGKPALVPCKQKGLSDAPTSGRAALAARSPQRRVAAGPQPAAPKAKQLEPSLQAWAASRRSAAQCPLVRNIGASESAAIPTPDAAAEMSVDSRLSRSASREKLTVPQEFNLSTPCSSLGGDADRPGQEQFGRVDWERTLRSRSKSAGPWKPELTVPRGPVLHTEFRPRSRSRGASRSASPAATPERCRSSTPRGDPSTRERTAIEQHNGRLAAGRLCSASPMRSRRLVMASPARSVQSARGRSMPTPSPARSQSAGSDASYASRASRLSVLSQPRSISRPMPTTEELELREARRGRRALKELMRHNERSLCEALVPEPTLGSVNSRVSHLPLTVPLAPELHTESRARSRSASRGREGSAAPEMRNMGSHAIPLREQAAIERHLELACLAHALPSATLPLSQPAPHGMDSSGCPQGIDRDEWVRAGLSAHDRAARARVVAQEQRQQAEAVAKQRLCIFKPTSAAAGAGEANREEDRARLCVFKAPAKPAEDSTAATAKPAAPVAMERVVIRSKPAPEAAPAASEAAAPADEPAEEPCAEPCPPAAAEAAR